MKITNSFLLIIVALSMNSCATFSRMVNFTHVVLLVEGDTKAKVLQEAAHIVGNPREISEFKFPKSSDNGETELVIEGADYAFTVEKDLVLYFFEDTFIQAGLKEPNSKMFPAIRPDFSDIENLKNKRSNRVAYLLKKNNRTSSIETIVSK